jgi:hypothetical protein
LKNFENKKNGDKPEKPSGKPENLVDLKNSQKPIDKPKNRAVF